MHNTKFSLALQGGGAHGAFTWGVLDKLLEANITIDAISAASAGALNGTLYCYGINNLGRTATKKLLHDFWKQVSGVLNLSLFSNHLLENLTSYSSASNPGLMMLDFMRTFLSPSQFNFLDINPVKSIIEGLVNFDKLTNDIGVKLFINATNVNTGKIKVFANSEITSKALLASCCIPYISNTVEIGNEHYWDGGFTGNPYLNPLIFHAKSTNIILVKVIADILEGDLTDVPSIIDRVSEICFKEALEKELQKLKIVNKMIQEKKLVANSGYRNIKVHTIENQEIIASLGRLSKLNFDWDFLQYLRDVGRQTAEEWLKVNNLSITK